LSTNLFSQLPATDKLIQAMRQQFPNTPQRLLKVKINIFLERIREQIKAKQITREDLKEKNFLSSLKNFLIANLEPNYKTVINATGVVIHTNLGRSLLAQAAAQAIQKACLNYSNLEFNLDTGKRGTRYSHVEELLCLLTGAEAGLVVNNNAAAVLIVLETLTKNKDVIVSRGELVEIGGSFRIPDVMAKSGAILKEVGTTNRTHLRDYEQAITENTGAILKVHTSNYRIVGFHKSVPLPELVALAQQYDLPVIEDMGSGNLIRFDQFGLPQLDEPTVQETIKAGVDVVSFSGDKLLGGPQAGIILGKKKYIELIKKNPLNRALRIDKMTLAGLEATLRLYLDPNKAVQEIPTLNLTLIPYTRLKDRAKVLSRRLNTLKNVQAQIKKATSQIGGGSLPEKDIPTYVVQVQVKPYSAEELRQILLKTNPPIIGRIIDDTFCLDMRTILLDQIKIIETIFAQIDKMSKTKQNA